MSGNPARNLIHVSLCRSMFCLVTNNIDKYQYLTYVKFDFTSAMLELTNMNLDLSHTKLDFNRQAAAGRVLHLSAQLMCARKWWRIRMLQRLQSNKVNVMSD